jgi:putative permease
MLLIRICLNSQDDLFMLQNKEYPSFLITLLLLCSFIYFTYTILEPAYLAIIVCYLLSAPQRQLLKLGCPRMIASALLVIAFFCALFLFILLLLPMITEQINHISKELPSWIQQSQVQIKHMQQNKQQWIDYLPLNNIMEQLKSQLTQFATTVIHVSLYSFNSLINLLIYLIIVPILSILMLHDYPNMLRWCGQFLPKKHGLLTQFWCESDEQMGFYLRGKLIELTCLFVVSYTIFSIKGLQYALVLSLLIGLSAYIPLVGAIIATIPVVIIGLIQWGFTTPFITIIILYTIIMVLDAYVLVPLLFSGTMKVHPAIILIALIYFGHYFGIIGIFFAIPLATVIREWLVISRKSLHY